MDILMTSSAFVEGGLMPKKYTCDGQNVSPPLGWATVPEGTKSIALICEDPDAPAGMWVHWVICNIPPNAKGLPENVPADRVMKNGATQGLNDFRKTGYGGPCPPGGTHRYFFKVYALDITLTAPPGMNRKDLLGAMEGHIVGQGQLMARYKRG